MGILIRWKLNYSFIDIQFYIIVKYNLVILYSLAGGYYFVFKKIGNARL